MEDRKNDFTFYLFVGFAILFLIIELSFVFFLNKTELYGLSFPKSGIFVQFYDILLSLNNTFLGKFFINKTLIILFISFASATKGHKKNIKTDKNKQDISVYFVFGLIFALIFIFNKFLTGNLPVIYAAADIILFAFFAHYAAKISGYFNSNLLKDRFGLEGRQFKQTKEKIENEFSVNIKTADGWINIINPFRGVSIIGTPGSGKTFALLLEAIEQHIKKGFSMFVYDYKYPELTTFTYNAFMYHYDNYKIKPQFCIINFDDPSRTHRSNPLHPDLLHDFTDAVEAAKSILLGLNKSWISKEGDFFVEGPINFLAICIWALRLEQNGIYCSLPHVIELVSKDYDELFGFLQKFTDDASIQNVLQSFSSALEKEAYDQLEGQVASVRNGLTRLTSPLIYYVMTTGEEEYENVSLDINNPDKPKIFCIGNNPKRQQIYSACISLYNNTIMRIVNDKNKQKLAMIWDELPTLSFPKGTLDNIIATGRSNKIATWLGFQDKTQLVRDLGEKVANAIFSTVGNIITGMVLGKTAEELSKMFGKIKVMKKSFSTNKGVVTDNYSEEMQEAISESRLSSLSQGWFAGLTADNFDQTVEQKFFHSKIIVDTEYRKNFNQYKIPKIFDFEKSGYTEKQILDSVFNKVRKEVNNLTIPFSRNSNSE